MKNAIRFGVTVLGLASALSFAPWAAAATDSNGNFEREIVLPPDAKYVNVNDGEIVKITDSATGKSFVWNVDTLTSTELPLSKVAPAGVLSHDVEAYVSNTYDSGE